jgi:SAM-dependent methyltransferase
MSAFYGRLRRTVGAVPVIGPIAKRIYRMMALSPPPPVPFTSSTRYWEDRYAVGGNSGAGSYGRLARFKADVINKFVAENAIQTVVEFGCGDGAQLNRACYPQYTGIDISPRAIELCQARFSRDTSKRFLHAESPEADSATADLALSLDVIYHLVEDDTYDQYMSRLVLAAKKYICIYSSNIERSSHVAHVRHRCFTNWLMTQAPEWRPILKVPNPYQEDPANPTHTSWADFYFFGV